MVSPPLDRAVWRALSAQLGRAETAWPTVAVLVCDGLLATGALLIAERRTTASAPFAVAALTLALLHFYLLQHECVHGAVFGRAPLNRWLGHLLGFALLYPFPQRRRAHLLHHGWAGHPRRDPANRRAIERLGRLSPRALRWCERLWRVWVPFLVIQERTALWREPFCQRDAAPARREERVTVFAYALGYLVVLVSLALLGRLFLIALYVPALALSLVLEEVINLPHHAEAPLSERALHVWEQPAVTHSCRSRPFWSRWVLLHFNLHTAHHLFPNLPWYRLPNAQRALGSRGSSLPDELAWNWSRRRRAFHEVFARYFRPPV